MDHIVCDDDILTKRRLKLSKEIRKQRAIIREFENATSLSALPPFASRAAASLNRSSTNALNLNDAEEDQDAEIRWYQYSADRLASLQRQQQHIRLEGGKFTVYPCQRSRASIGLRKLQIERSLNRPAEMVFISRYGVMRWYSHDYAARMGRTPTDGDTVCGDSGADDASKVARNNFEPAMRVDYIDQLKSVRSMRLQATGRQAANSSESEADENVLGVGEDANITSSSSISSSWLLSSMGAVQDVAHYARLRPPPAKNARVVHLQWKDGRQTWLIATEGKELVETIGAHLKHYNFKKANAVAHLKTMIRLQLTLVDCLHPVNPSSLCGELLGRLWSAFFSQTPEALGIQQTDSAAYLSYHEYWKIMGFQSCRPCSDFRGSGLLGLVCLVHLAEKAAAPLQRQRSNSSLSIASTILPSSATIHSCIIDCSVWWMHDMIMRTRSSLISAADKTVSAELTAGCRTYPWAVAGINMAMAIIQRMLIKLPQQPQECLYRVASDPNWDSRLLTFLSYLEYDNDFNYNNCDMDDDIQTMGGDLSLQECWRDNKNMSIFQEFFCYAMGLLDRAYSETGATYMDFQRILSAIVEKIDEWIGGQAGKRPAKLLSFPISRTSSVLSSSISTDRPLTMADLFAVSASYDFASASSLLVNASR